VTFLLISSGGLLASAKAASTKAQLQAGPQKCTVLGPTGELMNFEKDSILYRLSYFKLQN